MLMFCTYVAYSILFRSGIQLNPASQKGTSAFSVRSRDSLGLCQTSEGLKNWDQSLGVEFSVEA
jgi:hypothetical protein